jgi:ribosomal protein S18 acetylase RimI-like enzyme
VLGHFYFYNMSLRIEKVTAADAKLVTELSRKTFYDTFIEHNSEEDMMQFLDTYFIEPNIAEELSRPTNICYVAYDNNEAVGYANLRENNHAQLKSDSCLEIGRIYVVENTIGKGIGKLLMQQSLNTAIELNKEIIWLGVWEHNPRAIQFYQKWGFEKFGEHKFILGKDVQNDWLMKRQVRS